MKNKVIEFFRNLPDEKHEQFNTAFELYRKSEGNNESIVRSLNAVGYTESNLQNVLYDLQKLHGITDAEKVKVVQSTKSLVLSSVLPDEILAFSQEELRAWAQSQDVRLTNVIEETIVIALESEENTIAAILQEELDALRQSQGDSNGYIEGVEGARPDNSDPGTPVDILKAENETLLSEKEELEYDKEVLEDENSDLQDENEALKEKVNELTAVTGTSIREEFPFLNNKDCPNELKILVADKITAWKEYAAAHDQLLKIESGELVLSKEEQAEIAEKAKTAFEENQAIYDELNAYKETGKVLGKHPIFKTLQFQREVDEMTPQQLNKYIGSSSKYFSDNKKSLAKAEQENDEVKIIEIKERVADREQKLAMVNKKLGIVSK